MQPAKITLYKLWEKKLLPSSFVITGAARRDPGRDTWVKSLGEYPQDFIDLLDYVSCDLDDPESFYHLPETDDTTYFLSVPPERYENAITSLKGTGFLDDPETSRVVIENPLEFLYDSKSADHLQSVVGRHLQKQVYRIDHYLGKDTVNNILATHFWEYSSYFWNREYIEEVQIFATETIGCEGRSQYYEGAGVVRDMLQNHMLQVLALITVEAPCRMDAKEIRREKVKVLSATRLGTKLICGQYDGKSEEGVDPYSNTPTFVAGDLYIDNWVEGSSFSLHMTGKKMPYGCVEVVIKLKAPPIGLFEGETPGRVL